MVAVLRRFRVDNALLATVFSISQAIQPAHAATSPESVNSLLLNSMDGRQIIEKPVDGYGLKSPLKPGDTIQVSYQICPQNQVPLRCEESAAPVEFKVERLGADGIVLSAPSGELILKAEDSLAGAEQVRAPALPMTA